MEEEKIRYKDLSFWLKLAVIGGLTTFISFIIVALTEIITDLAAAAV